MATHVPPSGDTPPSDADTPQVIPGQADAQQSGQSQLSRAADAQPSGQLQPSITLGEIRRVLVDINEATHSLHMNIEAFRDLAHLQAQATAANIAAADSVTAAAASVTAAAVSVTAAAQAFMEHSQAAQDPWQNVSENQDDDQHSFQ